MTDQAAQPVPPRGPSARRRLLRIVAVVAVVAIIAAVYGIGHLRSNPAATACASSVAAASRLAPLAHGEVAALAVSRTPFMVPDLTFQDAAGHPHTLADWRGRTVLLNIWATWCVPCRREMPALDALEGDLGGGKFQVVAVNIDMRNPDRPRAFLKDAGVKHLAFYSDPSGKVFQTLKSVGKAFGMPTTLLVGRSGCEIGEMAGPAEWSSPDGVKLVTAALANPD